VLGQTVWLNLYKSFSENYFLLCVVKIFSRGDPIIYLIVFFSAIALKTVTELIAYPYAIGYDVINYYIPMLYNFDNEWNTILRDYPIYMQILHFIQNLTGLSAQATVSTFATFVFGLFAVSILSMGKAINRNNSTFAVLLSLFVIVQIPILRTTWDLHRDMFSLTMMFLAISILIQLRKNNPDKYPFLVILCCLSMTALSVISDRMVGSWLIVVYSVYFVLCRERIIALNLVVASASVITLLAVTGDGYSIISSITRSVANLGAGAQISGGPGQLNDVYNQTNLFSYFIGLNVLLIPLAVVGYMRLKEPLLKVSLLIALVGSLTWLVFPYARELVADRWILLFGISLSIIAGYGFIKTIQMISKWLRNTYMCMLITAMIFSIFAQFGIAYAVLPYGAHVSIIGLFDNIEKFAPKTMQFNSVRIDQSPMLLDIIQWVNQNTPDGSKIIGSIDWRGWFISELSGTRSFIGHERLENLFRNTNYASNDQVYLIGVQSSDDSIRHITNSSSSKLVKAHSNSLFDVYRFLETPKNMSLVH
jgi:hypothetical protein